MSDTPYREAWAALHNFAQSFAAPLVAIVPVLEQAKNAEEYIATLQPQIDDMRAELDVATLALTQAKADRETVLESIERDRAAKQNEANEQLEARRVIVAQQLDALNASVVSAREQTESELAMFRDQREERLNEQRELDAVIRQKRALLAELCGKVAKVLDEIA